MKVKFLAAPLVVGALMAPAAFSGATAHAAPVAPMVAVSATQPNKTLSVAEAQKELQVVNARIASLLDTSHPRTSPTSLVSSSRRPNGSRKHSSTLLRVGLPS